MAEGPGGKETRRYFKLYARDFLASPKVGRMDAEERGLYFTVLLRSWDEDGYVLDTEDLADELGIDPGRVEEILAGRVGRCFYTDEQGRMRNRRLERERADAVALTEKRKAAGAKGGQAKPSPAKQTEAIASTTQANAKPSQANGSKSKPPESESVSECSNSQSLENSPTAGGGAREARQPAPPVATSDPGAAEQILSTYALDGETRTALLEWIEQRGTLGKPYRTPKAIARLGAEAERDPAAMRERIQFAFENEKEHLSRPPSGWRPSGNRSGPLTGRAAVQKSNEAEAQRFVENATGKEWRPPWEVQGGEQKQIKPGGAA